MALPLTLSNLSATLKNVFNIDKFGIDASALTATKTITIADTSITSLVDIIVPDEVYDATAWNGNLEVPTKNAIRDQLESLDSGACPFFIPLGETFTVPENKQVLAYLPCAVDGYLILDGYWIQL